MEYGNSFDNIIKLVNESKIETKSIGVVAKNIDNINRTLSYNIGSGRHGFDGYGSNIGTLGEQELNMNSKIQPWFFEDPLKNDKEDYLDYINSVYFQYNGGVVPYHSVSERNANLFKLSSLDVDKNKVGVVRNYDIFNGVNDFLELPKHTSTNVNGHKIDTRLGIINNYYLSATLYASEFFNYSKSGSYNRDNSDDETYGIGKYSITQGAYSKFGIYGEMGIGGYSDKENYIPIRKQSELTSDIIPWTTSDHFYGSSYSFDGGVDNTSLSSEEKTADMAQGVSDSNLRGGFGDFHSINYSLGLSNVSGSRTQNFIAKSMFGYDLMDERFNDIRLEDESDNNWHSGVTGKKYYATKGSRGTNYIDKMTAISVDYDTDVVLINGRKTQIPIRYQLIDSGNDNLWASKYLYSYAESEGTDGAKCGSPLTIKEGTFNEGIEFGRYKSYDVSVTDTKKDIIAYTNERFLLKKYDTLIGRFHSDRYESETEARAKRDITSTAISQWGMSRGRNLLRKNKGENNATTDGEGYTNPYCRVWTFHHQYSKVSDLIKTTDFKGYGVRDDNNLVRVAPSNEEDIKRCMFSIENLAWKYESPTGGGGPNGGKIMWFPPYNLKFDESTNVNWSSTSFIGRGENIYSYVNTERSGTLSFTLLIDHPSLINKYAGSIGGEGIGDVDDTESNEQTLLRFFAGCERLMPNPTPQEEDEKPKLPPRPKPLDMPKTSYEKLYFYVYFPNNYSGEDDSATGLVKPMYYLINGISTQKRVQSMINGKETDIDFGTTTEKYTNSEGEIIGGYEMRPNGGLSPNHKDGMELIKDKGIVTNADNFDEVALRVAGIKSTTTKYFYDYRVDKRTLKEVLKETSFYDTNSFQLNSVGYMNAAKYHSEMNQYINEGKLFSFADVFYALDDNGKKMIEPNAFDPSKVAILKKLFSEFTPKEVTVEGSASSHGMKDSNNTLAKQRYLSVRAWLKTYSQFKNATFIHGSDIVQPNKMSHKDIGEEQAKAWRFAKVTVTLEKEEIVDFSENVNQIDDVDTYLESNKSIMHTSQKDTEERKIKSSSVSPNSKVQHKSLANAIEDLNRMATAEADEANANGDVGGFSTYDSGEYEYFKMLSETDSFLHSKIVDKIQYFDPAFHSMTPEGFNSRLNFLNQCTRQGSTMSASDGKYGTANNLAFGAPPICVLRIGDFYNTRILIDNVNISYDVGEGVQWDMNDAGIGVMPMMANVNISFKFIGGSDLSGPVRQLQNAVSFNYYANTSRYNKNAKRN